MGKKAKKKGRTPTKEKRIATHSSKTSNQASQQAVETVDNGVSAEKEARACMHLDDGADLTKLSAKFGNAEAVRCEGCRENAGNRRGNKGKGKHGKKKFADSKSESKAVWVCLKCGHCACGGIGLPTTSQSHAVRHARQTRHPLAIQLENPNLRWCFPCNMLIPTNKPEEEGAHKDLLSDVAKLIKERSSGGLSMDNVEDVSLGSGSVTSDIKLERTLSSSFDGNGGYVVRGLVNLGNTCFFNSIMQNILAMNVLRDHFFKLDESVGPLTIALKKLFGETKPETGLKNVINPRSFFGTVCSKAPQFRGYQQHDSHELLRCLLDNLCIEELGARKRTNSAQEGGSSPNLGLTLVDSVFGGEISSTVCCIECGHSSTVYEPFLDLSLPVPTKKPASKQGQVLSRVKKTKLPPKKGGRTRQKVSKNPDVASSSNFPHPSCSGELSSCQAESIPVAKVTAATSGSACSDSLAARDSAVISEKEKELANSQQQSTDPGDDSTWLDFLGSGNVSDEQILSSANDANSVNEDSGNKDIVQDDGPVESSSLSGSQVHSFYSESNEVQSSSAKPLDDEVPLQVQESEVLLLPYKEEILNTGDVVAGDVEELEASSLVMDHGHDEMDFDGFGDLFSEPEVAAGPSAKPSLDDGNFLGDDVAEAGFLAGNNTESDPDEVDSSDSPVSVESCLCHFIKPELLCNDNAWYCENCSKTLAQKTLEAKRRAGNVSKTHVNGSEIRSQHDPQIPTDNGSHPTEIRNRCNGNVKRNKDFTACDENMGLQSGEIDCLNKTSIKTEYGPSDDSKLVGLKEENIAMKDAEGLTGSSFCSTCREERASDQATGSSGSNQPRGTIRVNGKATPIDSPLSDEHEAEEDEDDEMELENVKVKRDAIKRVLIHKAPPVLTIHLKRFSHDMRGRLSKLNGHVIFKETIDLRPYMDSRCAGSEKYIYRLVGVVEHMGSMRGGHYVAYVRGAGRNGGLVWYHASDAYVREVSLEEVFRCEAYILFYEKI